MAEIVTDLLGATVQYGRDPVTAMFGVIRAIETTPYGPRILVVLSKGSAKGSILYLDLAECRSECQIVTPETPTVTP